MGEDHLWSLGNTALGVTLATILTAIAARYWWGRDASTKEVARLRDLNAERDKRISELENKLALVNQAVVPISAAFQAILIKELTHHHMPTLDALLEKIGPPNVLTGPEARALSVCLDERAHDMAPGISDGERDAAVMLPLVMRRVALEKITPAAGDMQIKVVSVSEPASDKP